MKKFFVSFFAASLMLLGTQAFAQIVPGAGYLRSMDNVKATNGNSTSADAKNGFYLGASYNIPIAGVLGVAPGFYVDMLFQHKDTNGGSSYLNYTGGSRYTEVDLNIPVNFTLKFGVGSNASIVAFAGPVFQYTVMARSTYNAAVSILGINISDGTAYNHLDAKNGDTNPFNIYLGGGAGVQVGDLQFIVGYDYSMLNRMNTKNFDGYDSRRGNLKVGVNFAF